MGGSEHRKIRLYAAVLSLGITVTALGNVPLVAQARNTSCLDAKWVLFAPLGQSGDNDVVASVLPSLPNFFVEVETQTFTGRLTCADPRPAFYNCGRTKQSVWGCKPDCFIESDGSQYVLETSVRSYSVTGDPDKIRPFLKDGVTVTGKLKGETIKAVKSSLYREDVKKSAAQRHEF